MTELVNSIVCITWSDTINSNIWKYSEDDDLKLDTIKTVGRVLKEDDTAVWMAGTWGGRSNGYLTNNQQIVIPKGVITDVEVLATITLENEQELPGESYRAVSQLELPFEFVNPQ